MGLSVSLRGASPRQRPVAAGCEGSALERPEGANGRFWADSGRAPVRAPISAHLLAQHKTAWSSVLPTALGATNPPRADSRMPSPSA